ncbi:MAG: hypothetical protein ACYDCL_05530 [Myxococcales bacterium]
MFRFVRWLCLLGVIAALVGFLLSYRLQGRTAAERVCGLARSDQCLRWAVRGGTLTDSLIARWEVLRSQPQPAAPVKARRRPPQVVDGTRTREAPPLDRHTPQERAALDRILAQRASH